MLSKRTLENYRREALKAVSTKNETIAMYEGSATGLAKAYIKAQEHVLAMTQDLIDIWILRGNKK